MDPRGIGAPEGLRPGGQLRSNTADGLRSVSNERGRCTALVSSFVCSRDRLHRPFRTAVAETYAAFAVCSDHRGTSRSRLFSGRATPRQTEANLSLAAKQEPPGECLCPLRPQYSADTLSIEPPYPQGSRRDDCPRTGASQAWSSQASRFCDDGRICPDCHSLFHAALAAGLEAAVRRFIYFGSATCRLFRGSPFRIHRRCNFSADDRRS